MNPWPFVLAAYSVTIGATVALILWSHISMRRAERRLEELRRK